MDDDKPIEQPTRSSFILHIAFDRFPRVGGKVKFAFPDRTYEGTVIRVNVAEGTYDVQVNG